MTFDQLSHFAGALKIDVDPELLRRLFDAGEFTTLVRFFEFTAPELKGLGLGKQAATFVSKCNKARKQPLDVVLHAIGLDEKVARALAGDGRSLEAVRALQASELAELPLAKAQEVVAMLKAMGAELDGLDMEMQIKPMKVSKKK